MAELTPMKRQYYEIKQRNPDCLLFFRLGDFYEMFDDDARLAARELDLTLTTRDRNVEDPAERTPMCGVPYHSAEAYIGRLIAKGYKVAICEQMEDPALAKGLVERDIIRIITPGTVTESSMLEENKSNYLGAVYLNAQSGGTAFCDLSTGEFCAASYPADAVSHILNELGRFAPREAVCADAAAEHDEIRTFLTKRLGSLVEAGGDRFEYLAAAARVCEQFDVQSTDELGLGEAPAAVCAAGALLAYLHETQKCDLGHIRRQQDAGGGHAAGRSPHLTGLPVQALVPDGGDKPCLALLDGLGQVVNGAHRHRKQCVFHPSLPSSSCSSSSGRIERMAPSAVPVTVSASDCLACCNSTIFSSMVSCAMSLYTCTGFCCPMR